MKDMFSLIHWNERLVDAPTDDLLIIYRDDSGDSVNYYTLLAYKMDDRTWIRHDNRLATRNILCWAELPKFDDMKIFK